MVQCPWGVLCWSASDVPILCVVPEICMCAPHTTRVQREKKKKRRPYAIGPSPKIFGPSAEKDNLLLSRIKIPLFSALGEQVGAGGDQKQRAWLLTSQKWANFWLSDTGPVSAHFVAMLSAAAPKHSNKLVFGAESATFNGYSRRRRPRRVQDVSERPKRTCERCSSQPSVTSFSHQCETGSTTFGLITHF